MAQQGDQQNEEFGGQQPVGNEGSFQSDDQRTAELEEGRNHGATAGSTGMGGSEPSGAPGYGDQGPAGQGGDLTGGTSVTGEEATDDEDAELSDIDLESDMDGEDGDMQR